VRGDNAIVENGKSEFFAGKTSGVKSEAGMSGETFADFIEYANLLADGAREEVRGGYIEPTPYQGACAYCRFGGSCGFCKGDKATPRQSSSVKAEEIAEIVRKKKGDDDNA
jgi:hypothetical protein